MSRKLFTLAAGVSAVLCVGVCMLWVRSYWHADEWGSEHCQAFNGRASRMTLAVCTSSEHRVRRRASLARTGP